MDAAAVVDDGEFVHSPFGKQNLNAPAAGVETIFNEFFERAGGAFHHFAGRDLVHQNIGDAMNTGEVGFQNRLRIGPGPGAVKLGVESLAFLVFVSLSG
jgi:hypothetical protein